MLKYILFRFSFPYLRAFTHRNFFPFYFIRCQNFAFDQKAYFYLFWRRFNEVFPPMRKAELHLFSLSASGVPWCAFSLVQRFCRNAFYREIAPLCTGSQQLALRQEPTFYVIFSNLKTHGSVVPEMCNVVT